jgi:hypothetical protein
MHAASMARRGRAPIRERPQHVGGITPMVQRPAPPIIEA